MVITVALASYARDTLVQVQSARLGCLLWELEESPRKRSWSVRPEIEGTETDAWRRALLRFSGSFDWRAGTWTRSRYEPIPADNL
jgi:hypothetical protein